jgi:hypothetical protein
MAKVKTSSIAAFMGKPKRKRKGVHAKTKTSKSKTANNYVKLSRGQG